MAVIVSDVMDVATMYTMMADIELPYGYVLHTEQ